MVVSDENVVIKTTAIALTVMESRELAVPDFFLLKKSDGRSSFFDLEKKEVARALGRNGRNWLMIFSKKALGIRQKSNVDSENEKLCF